MYKQTLKSLLEKKFGSKVYEDIPFVHIFDDADFNDLKSRIKRGKIQAFIGGMINQIKHRKIDVLIFDVDCSTVYNSIILINI